jgi:hypothetical protein
MKQFNFNIRLNFAWSLEADNEKEAREIVKDTFMQDYNLDVIDREITLDEGTQEDRVLKLQQLVLELRDALIQHGDDESTLKDIFTYYGHEQLADFGKEEYEDDSEL